MTVKPLDDVIWWPGIDAYIKPGRYDATTMQLIGRVLNEADEHTGMTIVLDEEDFVALNSEEERFRSFAERYVIERSVNFRVGHEQEDAWAAMLDAKGIYTQIRGLGTATFGTQDTQDTQGSSAAQVAPPNAYHSGGGGNPIPKHKKGGLVPTQANVLAALEAAKTAPKKGSLAKLKAAVARVGTRAPKLY